MAEETLFSLLLLLLLLYLKKTKRFRNKPQTARSWCFVTNVVFSAEKIELEETERMTEASFLCVCCNKDAPPSVYSCQTTVTSSLNRGGAVFILIIIISIFITIDSIKTRPSAFDKKTVEHGLNDCCVSHV